MVPLKEPGRHDFSVQRRLPETQRFQICSLGTCCNSDAGGGKYCTPSLCCYAIS
ncbi:hypothetical protein Hanom_Chr08g00709371 [Helianthus anomalus]